MGAATRLFPAILNTNGKIAANKVEVEARIPYSCHVELHYSYDIIAAD
jgi:hypothetical protein